MSGEKIPIVFFPRFTTLVGTTGFETTPIDMLGFESFDVAFWRTELQGTSPTLSFKIQQSADLIEWTDLSTTTPTPPISLATAGTPVDVTGTPKQRYIRCVATLGGTDPIVTIWAVGYAEKTQM